MKEYLTTTEVIEKGLAGRTKLNEWAHNTLNDSYGYCFLVGTHRRWKLELLEQLIREGELK